jgi:hypothetical protein
MVVNPDERDVLERKILAMERKMLGGQSLDFRG